jgi:hypothetical protein
MTESDLFLNDRSLIDLKKLLVYEQLKYTGLDYCLNEQDNIDFAIRFRKQYFTELNKVIDSYSGNNLSENYFLDELSHLKTNLIPIELKDVLSFNKERQQYMSSGQLSEKNQLIFNKLYFAVMPCEEASMQIFNAVLSLQEDRLANYSKTILHDSINFDISKLYYSEYRFDKHLLIDFAYDKNSFKELSSEGNMNNFNQYFSARVIGEKILGMRILSADAGLSFKPIEFIKSDELEALNKVSGFKNLTEQINRIESTLDNIFVKHVGADKAAIFFNALVAAQIDCFKRLNLSDIGIDIHEGKRGNYR